MSLDTRTNLNNGKFEQIGTDILSLSGCTKIYGKFKVSSGATIQIQPNGGLGKYLVSDAYGNATWQSFDGITGANNGLSVQGKNIRLGGHITGQTNINIDSLGSNLIITGATSGSNAFGLSITNWDGEAVKPKVSLGRIVNSTGTADVVYLDVDETGIAMSSCDSTCRGCLQITSQSVGFGTQSNDVLSISQFISISQNNCQMRLYVTSGTSGCKAELCLGLGYMKICGAHPAGFPGVEYDTDYSENYTNRSLVDKGYVDTHSGGGGSSLSAFTITGDSTTTGFTINHAKNKQFVGVEIVRNISPYPTVYTNVIRPNANCVCISFDVAPANGLEYKVLITS